MAYKFIRKNFYYNGKKWKQIKGLAQSISSKKTLL